MNLLLTILGLIISIMALENKKILLVVKIGLIILISTKTYLLFFGDYYLWRDKNWTDENIYNYFNNGQFYKCLLSVLITYCFFIFLFPFIIRIIVKKIKPILNIENLNFIYQNSKIKFVKKYVNKVLNLYTENTETENIEIEKNILKELSNYLSTIFQLIIAWTIITPKITIFEYIIYFIFCIVILYYILITSHLDVYFKFIKKINNEHNRNNEQIPD